MFVASIIILISVFSTKLSKRFNIPLLIILLIVGMLAGSEGIGRIYFDDSNFAYVVATFALCFILFSGGLETRVTDIKPVLKEGISLSVLGVLLNAVLFAFPIILSNTFESGRIFSGFRCSSIYRCSNCLFSIKIQQH